MANTRDRAALRSGSGKALWVEVETDLTRPMVVGRGAVLPIRGWCSHPARAIRALYVLHDGVIRARANIVASTPDAHEDDVSHAGGAQSRVHFVALVPILHTEESQRAELTLEVVLSDNTRASAALGTVSLLAHHVRPVDVSFFRHPTTNGEPRVAICMATYNPPLDLFEQQVDSIRSQTHQNWICLITDDCSDRTGYEGMERIVARDSRFHMMPNPMHQGFYSNFETCLRLVPINAAFVALADQDDLWYPDKLRASVAAFRADTMLVYSDMHIVARDGTLIYPTFWTNRRNNYTNLSALIWANTVTGAASIFRRELLDDVLPFPRRVGHLFHDHWIASVSLALGSIKYVDTPLYAYRQHDANVIGHTAGLPSRLPRAASILRSVISPAFFTAKMTAILWSRLDGYHLNVLKTAMIAKMLQVRGLAGTARKQKVVTRLARCDHSLLTLFVESAEAFVRRRPTLGTEWYGTRGAIANRILTYYRVPPPRPEVPSSMGS